ncbi:MAG: ribosome-associated translation inhibitor RaiA [Candidatus Margulisbacteria bacterium]|nr:ribosome-associated translation inhibitor RaiA [Candidatus Margulisiibacteriota bacterium]
MQIKISGHGTEVTPALRDYVQQRAAKLEEYFKNIQKVEIVLDARANYDAERRQVAEVRAWMSGKKMILAKEGGRDMYAAIDLVMEEVKKQIEKHKEKLGHEKIRKTRKWKLLSHLKIPGLPFFGGSKEL